MITISEKELHDTIFGFVDAFAFSIAALVRALEESGSVTPGAFASNIAKVRDRQAAESKRGDNDHGVQVFDRMTAYLTRQSEKPAPLKLQVIEGDKRDDTK